MYENKNLNLQGESPWYNYDTPCTLKQTLQNGDEHSGNP